MKVISREIELIKKVAAEFIYLFICFQNIMIISLVIIVYYEQMPNIVFA